MKQSTVPNEVLGVLDNLVVEGNVVRIVQQLDRKLYVGVNEVLEAVGGKWTRKVKGHVFPEDPTSRIEDVLLTGSVVIAKKNGYFPTPKPIVAQMIELARIKARVKALEPSAGQGAISDELFDLGCEVDLVELLPDNRKVLQEKGKGRLVADPDFMRWGTEDRYDRVVMNPPFEHQQDIDHVLRAYDLLKEGGVLVSVMCANITFRNTRKTVLFRELINESGATVPLPDASFKDSGTTISTVIVRLEK